MCAVTLKFPRKSGRWRKQRGMPICRENSKYFWLSSHLFVPLHRQYYIIKVYEETDYCVDRVADSRTHG